MRVLIPLDPALMKEVMWFSAAEEALSICQTRSDLNIKCIQTLDSIMKTSKIHNLRVELSSLDRQKGFPKALQFVYRFDDAVIAQSKKTDLTTFTPILRKILFCSGILVQVFLVFMFVFGLISNCETVFTDKLWIRKKNLSRKQNLFYFRRIPEFLVYFSTVFSKMMP